MLRSRDRDLVTFGVTLIISLVTMGVFWHFVLRTGLPPQDRIDLTAQPGELWRHFDDMASYSARLGQRLLTAKYFFYFTGAALPGALVFGAALSLVRRRATSLARALVGWFFGAVIGMIVIMVTWRSIPMPINPLLAALLMPGLAYVMGGLVPLLWVEGDDQSIVRGTQIKPHRGDSRRAMRQASGKGGTSFAGVMLNREAEVRHFAAIGVTGSGKSTALRELMSTALHRGDRHIVADPDGSAMKLFYRPGDIILNPFDRRGAKWDILAEIAEETDYRFLAEAVLPSLHGGDGEEWIRYSREIFVACLRTWHRNRLGSSDGFFQALATADRDTLATLCAGTAAHRYFEAGNEKMLGSIMGTMAPTLENLRQLAGAEGTPFSVRHWIRAGTGSLWMPYQANQIAALRGVISCWMGLAVAEALALDDSETRRIWFHIDELDALGRMQGLKDAQTRVRKKGGCVVIGFQSIAQLRAVYGAALADTIIENCDNKLILRCGASEGGGTAKFASDLIGEREVKRDETTVSRSRGKHASSSVSTHVRRQTEKAALASEIMQLADRSGYLKLATSPAWLTVRFDYVAFEERTTAYVPEALQI